ncbi:MAG: hypothetical protein ACUVV6_07970, partial [Thermoplasmatota archaeon]
MAEAGESARPPAEAQGASPSPGPRRREYWAKVLLSLFFMTLTLLLLSQAPWAGEAATESQNQTTTQLAEALFEGHGASLVILSLVMGAATIGGLYLAREDPLDGEEPVGSAPPGESGRAATEREGRASGTGGSPGEAGGGQGAAPGTDGGGGRTGAGGT